MRPIIHLTAPVNWLNDPVGLIQLDGRYHVFYQHHPHAPAWGRMQWGHASSADLANWVQHAPALLPGAEPGAPDHDGCWSGSVAIVQGTPTAFYTGANGRDEAHRESICVARSSGLLVDWVKDPANPILGGEPRPGRLHQRDPFVFMHGGRWIMLLGTGLTGNGDAGQGSDGLRGAGGAVAVLESTDALTWHDRGILFGRLAGEGAIDTGPMWECPQLMRLGEHWVLVVSIQARGGPDPITVGAVWFIGDIVDEGAGGGLRFRPDGLDSMGWVDGGDVLYAPAVMTLDDGRILSWAWLRDPNPDLSGGGPVTVGALSLPRVLGVAGGMLTSEPPMELDRLARGSLGQVSRVDLEAGARQALGPPGRRPGPFRLTLELDLGPAASAGVVVAASPDGLAEVALVLERHGAAIVLQVVELAGGMIDRGRCRAHLPATAGLVRLDVWVDGSIVEAFAAGAAIATRLDRRVRAAEPLELAVLAGTARFTDVTVTALQPAVTIAPV